MKQTINYNPDVATIKKIVKKIDKTFPDIITFIHSTATVESQFYYDPKKIFQYCAHIVKERSDLSNWKENHWNETILGCDPILLFTQKLATNQFSLHEVIIKENNIQKTIHNINKLIESSSPNFLTEKFEIAPEVIQELFNKTPTTLLHEGLNPSTELVKAIVTATYGSSEFNNDLEIENDFKIITKEFLDKNNFKSIPNNVETDMAFKNKVTKILLSSWLDQMPGYENSEDKRNYILNYCNIQSEIIFIDDIDTDIPDIIIETEKNIIQHQNQENEKALKQIYLKSIDKYISKK